MIAIRTRPGQLYRRHRDGRVGMIASVGPSYPWVDLYMIDTGRLVAVGRVAFARRWERVWLDATAGGFAVQADPRATGYGCTDGATP